MPYVDSAGVPIYYELVGHGFPVVLQTGGGGDGTMWDQGGYLAGLKEFKLLLLDHRGHGRSGKPTALEAHRIEYYVSDVIAVLDAESIERAAFWGYSAGATVGYALAASHPQPVAGLVVQGATGAGDLDTSEAREGAEERARLTRERGLGTFIKELETAEGTSFPEWFMEQMTATDDEMFALEVLGASMWHGPWSVLGDIRCPVLMLVGEQEDPEAEGTSAAASLRNARCVTFPALGHVGACVRSDLALGHAVPFLRGVAKHG